MNQFNRRTKQWIYGGVIISLSVLVWMVYFYFPLREIKKGYIADINAFTERVDLLEQRSVTLEALEGKLMSQEAELTRFSAIMVFGETLEDINAATQMLFQNFFDQKDIKLSSYKVLSGSVWKNYELGMLEFNIATSMTGLDAILKFVEGLDRVIKIETLLVNYTGNKATPLGVKLRVETLFIDMGIEKGK